MLSSSSICVTVERNVNVDLIVGCPQILSLPLMTTTDEFLIVRLLSFAQTFDWNVRIFDFEQKMFCAYSGVLSKWEFFIKMRAACFAPSFFQNGGVLEWGFWRILTFIWHYSNLQQFSFCNFGVKTWSNCKVERHTYSCQMER